MMAGIAADIDQGCRGGRIGHFAPRLAALAAKHVYGAALTDVTTGINWNNFTIQTPGSNDLTRNHAGAYTTTKGFDLATGYGSPIASGLACPTVLSMTPNHGKAGARVTLHGVGLEKATIKFGSTKARVVSASAKSAVVIVPKGKGIVNVRGTSAFGTGVKAAPFSYLGPDRGLYRTVTAAGHVYNFGGALGYGSPTSDLVHAPITGMAVDHATGGYWLVAADGTVYNFNAPFLGDASARPLNQPIVGMAANETGDGYWLVARDGGIFAFGRSKFYGSTGGMHLNKPIVGIAANAEDRRLLARRVRRRDLRVPRPVPRIDRRACTSTSRSSASRRTSRPAATGSSRPTAGSSRSTPRSTGRRARCGSTGRSSAWPRPRDARGYRFVASDGGVFNFGDAKYGGSTGGAALTSPVVAISPVQ